MKDPWVSFRLVQSIFFFWLPYLEFGTAYVFFQVSFFFSLTRSLPFSFPLFGRVLGIFSRAFCYAFKTVFPCTIPFRANLSLIQRVLHLVGSVNAICCFFPYLRFPSSSGPLAPPCGAPTNVHFTFSFTLPTLKQYRAFGIGFLGRFELVPGTRWLRPRRLSLVFSPPFSSHVKKPQKLRHFFFKFVCWGAKGALVFFSLFPPPDSPFPRFIPGRISGKSFLYSGRCPQFYDSCLPLGV